jgi:uncharacterized small protein (DUF1192 family)
MTAAKDSQGSRLEKIQSRFSESQVAFAQAIGLSAGFINKIISGKKGLSGNVINRISQKFPEVNIGWLVSGEGEMLTDNDPEKKPAAGVDVSFDALRSLVKEYERRLAEYEKEIRDLKNEVRLLREGRGDESKG